MSPPHCSKRVAWAMWTRVLHVDFGFVAQLADDKQDLGTVMAESRTLECSTIHKIRKILHMRTDCQERRPG